MFKLPGHAALLYCRSDRSRLQTWSRADLSCTKLDHGLTQSSSSRSLPCPAICPRRLCTRSSRLILLQTLKLRGLKLVKQASTKLLLRDFDRWPSTNFRVPLHPCANLCKFSCMTVGNRKSKYDDHRSTSRRVSIAATRVSSPRSDQYLSLASFA